jgi:hypothetical protein
MIEEADLELLAASLRADARDLEMFIEVLAVKLEGALPQRTQVVRRSPRLFSKRKRVERISVDLGEERLLLDRTATGLEMRHARRVRGVVVRSEVLELDEWIGVLVRALTQEVDTSTHGHGAIARLLGVEHQPQKEVEPNEL